MNLAGYQGIALDLSCEQPGALRGFSIYFKSGAGWYAWTGKINEPGRQMIEAMKSDFTAEGNPAGWNRIEAIRVSPWKGLPLNTSITVYGMEARNHDILIAQATRSAPNDAERSAARRATRRISTWLQAAGVSHGVLTEEELLDRGSDGVRLIILPYNPSLSAPLLALFKRHIAAGGKIMVFYSSSEELARLMGFRLGPYKSSPAYGQYAAIVFHEPERLHVPPQVLQESWNIRPAFPLGPSASVIAWWHTISGERTADPAWVDGPHGLWMSHILLDDDAQAKRRMLLGLIARHVPAVWPPAARLALHRAGRIGDARSLGDSIGLLLEQSREQVNSQAVIRSLINRAREVFGRMLNEYEARRYPAVVDGFFQLHEILLDAYARIQPPRPGEFCGVWDHTALGLYPGDWNRTARLLAAHGVTAVFPNIAWGGVAHYKSECLPASDSVRLYGDQLAQCVAAARRQGLEVHPWIVCWSLTGAPEADIARYRREGRLLADENGQTYPWLNPAHPDNRALLLAAVKEIISRYDVDGLHLDYIRYPGPEAGYDDYSRAAFEKETGRRVARWPGDVLSGGPLAAAFGQWRSRVITELVRDVHAVVRSVKPGIRLSAAVFGAYPECVKTRAQDWGLWLRQGYVDFVVPMNYTADAGEFERLLDSQLRLPDARGRIRPGIGVTASESQLTADQVIRQILALRERNCPGYLLFDLDPTLRDKILPCLSLGITRKR